MNSENNDIKTLKQILMSTDCDKAVQFIAQFLQKCITDSELSEEAKFSNIQQITRFLLNSTSDSNLKKGGLKCVMKLSSTRCPLICDEISYYFDDVTKNVTYEYDHVYNLFENVVTLIGNVPLASTVFLRNFAKMASLYEIVIRNSLTQMKHELTKVKEIQISKTLHHISQTLIIFVEKSCEQKTSIIFPRSLYILIREMMSCRKISINTINNCGLLVVTLDYNFFNMKSSIELLEQSLQSSPIECLALCHGYVASSSVQFYIESSSNHCNLIVLICDTLQTIYEKHTNDNFIIISVLKIISIFSKKISMKNHCIPEHLKKHLILILISNSDHFLNSAKNISKEALTQFIRQKDDFVISEILRYLETTSRIDRRICILLIILSSVVPYHCIISSYENVIEDLLQAATNSVSSSYICQAYVSLMACAYNEQPVEDWFNVWITPLLLRSENYALLLDQVIGSVTKLSDNILTKIINVSRTNHPVLVKCLLNVKTDVFLSENDLSELNLNSRYWKNLISFDVFEQILCIPNNSDALKMANLLIHSKKGKETFTFEEIELLKLYIDSQITVEKSDMRHKFLNLMTQLFTRISAGSERSQKIHENFVNWIISYCIDNLYPGASYERRFTALKILEIISDTNLWPCTKVNEDVKDKLFESLNDTYEENKETARNILTTVFLKRNEFMDDELKVSLCREILNFIADIRFTQHNTAAYFFEILCSSDSSGIYFRYIDELSRSGVNLENEKLRKADSYFMHLQMLSSLLKQRLEKLKGDNIVKYPLHGYLHVIRHLLKRVYLQNREVVDILQWNILIKEIVEILFLCNTFAISVVSHSSPEGYLPDDETLEISEDNVRGVAQRLLLCNWRTVKEASLLLGDLVENFPIGDDNGTALMDKNTFIKIGNHLKMLIYKIRHKGSFKQVYIAMFHYCRRCWRLPDRDINCVPKSWLMEIQNEILHNGKQLCLTRRGAGLPCIVLAILCTEFEDKHHYKSNLLKEFMNSMFEILNTKDIDLESKVHALNILCDLFKHKDMVEEINNYIEEAVIIAINGFKSTNWNERNTSNLLLSAILTRIFGVSRSRDEISWKNKMTGRMFFQKYPLLFDTFVLHLQQNIGSDVSVQSVLYPILLIFARLYPSYHDEWNSAFQLNAFIPYIYNCCQNYIFKIRQLAVQAIIPVVTRDMYVEHVYTIWYHLMLPLSENTKHGLLLQLEGILKNIPELDQINEEHLILILTKILLEADLILSGNHSFVVKEKMLIILCLILNSHYQSIDVSKMKNYPINENYRGKNEFCQLNEQNYMATLRTFNLSLEYLKLAKYHEVHQFVCVLERMIEMKSPENVNVTLEFIIALCIDENTHCDNLVLKFLLNDDKNKSNVKRAILESKCIFNFILNKLIDDHSNLQHKILIILPDFLKTSYDECAFDLLLSFGEKKCNNTTLMSPFFLCMDTLLGVWNYWNDKCLSVLKLLLSTAHKSALEYRRRMKLLFFKYYNRFSVKDEEFTLNVWTFVISNIISIDETEFILFEGLIRNVKYEDHLLLRKVIQEFCNKFQSKPLICAVGLISWIIKDVGRIFSNDVKNNVFYSDLPEYFEDQLLVCKMSFDFFEDLSRQYTSLLTDKLPEQLSKWLLKQASMEDSRASSLNDVISMILKNYETVKERYSLANKFIKNQTIEEQIVSHKISFLYLLLRN